MRIFWIRAIYVTCLAILFHSMGFPAEGQENGEAAIRAPDAPIVYFESRSAERAAQHKIDRALQCPTALEFTEAPLKDVVEYLRDLHAVEIQIDSPAIDEALCSPITANIRGSNLDSALQQMLRPLQLIAYCDGDVLLISTEARAARRINLRFYDCNWATPERFAEIIKVAALANIEKKPATSPGEKRPENQRVDSSDDIFAIMPVGKTLAVRANALQHDTIRRLLNELERIEKERDMAKEVNAAGGSN